MINLWRDDDVDKYTDLTTIINIQKLFDKYNKVHTVTVLMEGLWDSKGIWYWLMTTENIEIALHGWSHIDYALLQDNVLRTHLSGALNYWKKNIERVGYKFRPITVFYPPWNSITNRGIDIAREVGLEVSTKTRVTNPGEVYDFHWWETINQKGLNELEEALSK